jgi:hypothetical protein
MSRAVTRFATLPVPSLVAGLKSPVLSAVTNQTWHRGKCRSGNAFRVEWFSGSVHRMWSEINELFVDFGVHNVPKEPK